MATMVSSRSAFCSLLCLAAVLISSLANVATSVAATSAPQLDEQLYSRQIFVYGKSAQQSLSSSHVLVKGSNKPLAAEIVKNLALAGVGRLTIVDDLSTDSSSTSSAQLLCGGESLAEYARSLNPLVQAGDTTDEAQLATKSITVAVCAEKSMSAMKEFCSRFHALGIKHIGCNVKGVSGFVCDDFLKGFQVVDCDGEFSREIPLLDAEIVPSSSGTKTQIPDVAGDDSAVISDSSAVTTSDSTELNISSIEEERLGLGIGDFAELHFSADSTGEAAFDAPIGPLQVPQVHSSKTVILSVNSAVDIVRIVSAIKQGRVTAKKVKTPLTVDHTSLSDLLESISPTFAPCNGCLSDKKDRALSLCLLAAFKGIEKIVITASPVDSAADLKIFHSALISELKDMGVLEPLNSIKEGGVGKDMIDYVAERFLYSVRRGGQCPATVSVVGALAAQETIKAITSVHVPISQFLMFESLDSVLLPLPSASVATNPAVAAAAGAGGAVRDQSTASASSTTGVSASEVDSPATTQENEDLSAAVLVYGEEVAAELARMKVFVVGSGAIGCELLKTFSLLGVGVGADEGVEGAESERGEKGSDKKNEKRSGNKRKEEGEYSGLWSGLSSGGIVLADMDQIERSNLNRQLLFREKHVGMAKAEVAAETVKLINPRMKVKAAQNKICPETEVIFNSDFWGQVDVVATALDNVDARRYVDAQCVTHSKWLVDSGTLGSKGNTQVVIPFVSESYSSSSDPPEEDIPLCTLKSFPYQPEHCVAWARSKFDQLFSADIKTLQSCLELPTLSTLSSKDTAKDTSNDTSKETEGEQTEQTEEEGQVKEVDDVTAVLTSLGILLLSSDEINSLLSTLSAPQTTPQAAVEWAVRAFDSTYRVEAEHLLKEHPLSEVDENGVPFWGGSRRRPNPLTFDAADTVHRSFVLWAAVLRGRTCGQTDLRSPDDPRLLAALKDVCEQAEKQRAVERGGEAEAVDMLISMGGATRSSLLASLLPEEFEKDYATLGHVDFATAAANLRCRVYSLREVDRLEVQKIAGRIVPALATTTALVAGLVTLEIVKIATERILKNRKQSQVSAVGAGGGGGGGGGGKGGGDYLAETARVLKKFRNSFVNLARPLLAFAQPVEAESFTAHGRTFNMWSVLQAPKSLSKLTVSKLEEFLSERYGAHLQSVSIRDFLLYADFLTGSEELLDLPLDALIKRMDAEEKDLGSDSRDTGKDETPFLLNTDTNSFLDLEVVCVDDQGQDLRLPSVRVHFKAQKQKKSSKGGKNKGKKGGQKVGAAVAMAGKRLLSWMKKK